MKITYIVILLAVLALGVAYYTLSPLFIKKVVNEQAPIQKSEEIVGGLREGLVAKVVDTKSHPASGQVRIVEDDINTYIRYENFKTINGPDLFVYLSNDLDTKDFVSLGELRATEGNVNYKVPEGVDITKYKYVMIWCKQFGVLFNYADISNLK